MTKQILLILVLFMTVVACKKKDISVPGYAIGVVAVYNPGTSGASSIEFNYYLGGGHHDIQYSNGYNGWKVPYHANINIGDKYMVQYEQNDYETARMLFDYPVKDSSDFKSDTGYFATHAP